MLTRTLLPVLLILGLIAVGLCNREPGRRRRGRRGRGGNREDNGSESEEVDVGRLFRTMWHYYDNGFRPDFGGDAVQIQVELKVASLQSMSPNSGAEVAMIVTEKWQDSRLTQEDLGETIEFNKEADVLDMLWTPKTYFSNAVGADFVSSPYPLDKVTISTTGEITHVYRLDGRFPCSDGVCSIKLENFRYPSSEVAYAWLNEDSPFISDYDGAEVTSTEAVVNTVTRSYTTGSVSQLELRVTLA